MKKITWIALIAMLVMGCTLGAQDNKRDEDRRDQETPPQTENRFTAKKRAESMGKELELTAEQVAKVQALFEKQDAERAEQMAAQRERRDQAAGDRKARRNEMREAREKAVAEQDAELERIIGKEKTEQWKKSREERQQALRDSNRQGRRNVPRRR